MLRMCFNWKVLAGLAVLGLAVWVLAPGAAAAALPVLLALACPLSMLFMMQSMRRQGGQTPTLVDPGPASAQYTCTMHPSVDAAEPAACPICGMRLTPASEPALDARASDNNGTREERLAELQTRLEALSEQQTSLAQAIRDMEDADPLPAGGAVLDDAERVAQPAARGRSR